MTTFDPKKLAEIQARMSQMPPQNLGSLMNKMAKTNPEALTQLVTQMNPTLLGQAAKYMDRKVVDKLKEAIQQQVSKKKRKSKKESSSGSSAAAATSSSQAASPAPGSPTGTPDTGGLKFKRPKEFRGKVGKDGRPMTRQEEMAHDLGLSDDDDGDDAGDSDGSDSEDVRAIKLDYSLTDDNGGGAGDGEHGAGNGEGSNGNHSVDAATARHLHDAIKAAVKAKKRAEKALLEAEDKIKQQQYQLTSTQRISRSQIHILRNNYNTHQDKVSTFVDEVREQLHLLEESMVQVETDIDEGNELSMEGLATVMEALKEVVDTQVAEGKQQQKSFAATANGEGLGPLEEVIKENTELRKELEELRAHPPTTDNEELEAVKARNDELVKEMFELKQGGGSSDAMNDLKNENKLQQEAIAALEAQVNELKSTHSGPDAVSKTLHEQQIGELDAQLEEVFGEKTELEEKLETLEADWKAKESAMAQLMEDAKAGGKTVRPLCLKVAKDYKGFTSGWGALKEAVLEQQKQMGPLITQLQADVAKAVEQHVIDSRQGYDELMGKFKKEMVERKRLHNLCQELKGNIRVFCRSRPMIKRELDQNSVRGVTYGEDEEVFVKDQRGIVKKFEFDQVYGPDATQEDIFEDTEPLITSVIDGYNVCIFAYGQTGSGKTHTMQGPKDDPGVNTRALQKLLEVANTPGDWEYEVSVYMLEIYNEQVRDLLVKPEPGAPKLEIRQGDMGVYVDGISTVVVNCIEDVFAVMAQGAENRSVGETRMNADSSRSHSVFCTMVAGHNKVTGFKSRGKLTLVDLAGSERVGKSEATGQRLKEAQGINKSLSALGDVMASLQDGKAHIPYRNSQLTKLLQDSLGGDSKTMMFVHIAPGIENAGETICSLNFATRVHDVQLGQAKKHVDKKDRK